jgi:hypothetical protein
MRKPEPGDRYIDSLDGKRVFQVDSIVRKDDDGYEAWVTGISGYWDRFNTEDTYWINSTDKFIGNFSKSNKFKEIYDILNSGE